MKYIAPKQHTHTVHKPTPRNTKNFIKMQLFSNLNPSSTRPPNRRLPPPFQKEKRKPTHREIPNQIFVGYANWWLWVTLTEFRWSWWFKRHNIRECAKSIILAPRIWQREEHLWVSMGCGGYFFSLTSMRDGWQIREERKKELEGVNNVFDTVYGLNCAQELNWFVLKEIGLAWYLPKSQG